VIFGVWLLTGWQSLRAASALLLLSFGVFMVIALGWKAPLNYSVFTAMAPALALAVLDRPNRKGAS
jgi:hypothetical protein